MKKLFTEERQGRLVTFLLATERGEAVSFVPNDLRALLAEVARLRVDNVELQIACQAALWELQGHLEKGTAVPLLESALKKTTCPRLSLV